MLKLYYKIWVSLYLNVLEAQNKDNGFVLSALIAISVANFLNIFFVLFVLFFLFDIKFDIISNSYTSHRYSTVIFTALFIFLSNYFLLVFNNKHQRLLSSYQKSNHKNLGIIYFWVSALMIIGSVFLTIIFPEFFGLANAPS